MSLAPTPRRPRGRRSIQFERVPKPAGGVRTIARLDPFDADAFARAVGRVGPLVERNLRAVVLANRIDRHGSLAPWRPAWARWSAEIERRLRAPRPPIVVTADVRECYASIQDRSLADCLRRAGASEAQVDGILTLVAAFRDEGVVGLPVGPEPSAVLANAVLSVADEALVAVGVAHVRWVDDVVAFALDPRGARTAIDALHRSLAAVGLELNEAKTRIVDDPAEARAALTGPRPSLARGPVVA